MLLALHVRFKPSRVLSQRQEPIGSFSKAKFAFEKEPGRFETFILQVSFMIYFLKTSGLKFFSKYQCCTFPYINTVVIETCSERPVPNIYMAMFLHYFTDFLQYLTKFSVGFSLRTFKPKIVDQLPNYYDLLS